MLQDGERHTYRYAVAVATSYKKLEMKDGDRNLGISQELYVIPNLWDSLGGEAKVTAKELPLFYCHFQRELDKLFGPWYPVRIFTPSLFPILRVTSSPGSFLFSNQSQTLENT